MKTFNRPDYSLHLLVTKKTLSQLTLEDVLLILSTVPPEEKNNILVYRPSQNKWIRATEHEEILKTPFVLQRNVKPPQPVLAPAAAAAPPQVSAAAPPPSAKTVSAPPAAGKPSSAPPAAPVPPKNKAVTDSKNLTLSLQTNPPVLVTVLQVNLPLIKVDRDLPMILGTPAAVTLTYLNQDYKLVAQLEDQQDLTLLRLTGTKDYRYLQDLMAILGLG